MIKLFRDEDQYRHHAAVEVAISAWIESVLLEVCPWWKETYSVSEWWEDEKHPDRLIINYDTYFGPESWDHQMETALAILWCDDPQREHDEVQRQLKAESDRIAAAAKAEERHYVLVPETEEGERALLKRLRAKYPDAVGRDA